MVPHEASWSPQASYDLLVSALPDALILVLDANGMIRFGSPSFRAILGAPPTSCLGTPFQEALHPDDQAAARAALAAVLADPEAPASLTYRARHAAGSWRRMHATLTNRLADHRLAGIVLVGGDSTDEQATHLVAPAADVRWRALQAVTDAALAHLDLDALLGHVLEHLTAAMHVDNTAILLLDEHAHELRIYAARGPEEEVAGQVRVPFGQGVAGHIAATREPLIVDDMATANPANPFLRERIRSLLGVPLQANGRVLGVLHVGTVAPHRFTAEDLTWLQLVADRVALTIAHAQLFAAERAAREEADQRAQELEAVFEAIGDAVLVYDIEGRVRHANAAAHPLARLLAQAGSGALPLAGRTGPLQPRDARGRSLPPDEFPLARALRGERLVDAGAVDALVRLPDGRDVLLSTSAAPIRDTSGRITGAVTVLRDVTARRQVEQRTHDALEALLAMAQTLVELPGEQEQRDGAGPQTVRPVGQRLVELTRQVLGCERIGLAVHDSTLGVQHPIAVAGLPPELEQLWWESVEGAPINDPQASTNEVLLARFLAGEVLHIDLTQPPFHRVPNPFGIRTFLVAPLRVQHQIIGTLSLDYGGQEHQYTDQEVALAGAVAQLSALVLERDRLLQERAEAQASELALREVNRRMDEFLSIATHELRTPLTTIMGSIQLLQRRLQRVGTADGTALAGLSPLVEQAADQTSRLNRMMNELLDVSRIQTNQLALHLTDCDLAALVRQSVEETRLAWPARTISLAMPAAAVFVQADADRIRQVLMNFLTNALKYSAIDQPVEVFVDAASGRVHVRVRDHGPGLSEAQRATIWERFRRVRAVPVQDLSHAGGGGIGLGLYISRTIIAEHGGAVGVDAAPGAGSTFWFALPCLQLS